MVSECANPHCSAQFLYFGEGQLVALPRQSELASHSRVEFFRLCGECANHLELHVTLSDEIDLVERHSHAGV